jgi:hypothetical protein
MSDSSVPASHLEHSQHHDHETHHHASALESKFMYLIPVVALLGAMVVTGIIVKSTGAKKDANPPQQIDQVTPNTQVPQGTAQSAPDDIKSVVDAVSKLIVLPASETPKVVTITNVEQLKKDQPFFSDATNGDKLLVYSKKVILYNPRTNRVVDIAQIKFAPDTK